MRSKKRLGKSLEDISHLFLSGFSAPASVKSVDSSGRMPGPPAVRRTRVWLALSLVREVPSAFFAGNLGIELARCGRRTLLIETAPLPSLDKIFGTIQIQPSLNDLLEQSNKQVTIEGALGMRILSFRFCPDELREFSPEEQEILSQILLREEEAAELILIHAVYEEGPLLERFLKIGQGVILAASPSGDTILETYRVCKYLYSVHPGLRIGLAVYERGGGEATAAWKEKLTDAVGRFLEKSLEWHGTIPDDPLVEHSLTAKVPVTLLDRTSKTSLGFVSVAEGLQRGAEVVPARSATTHSFFNGFQRTLNGPGDP